MNDPPKEFDGADLVCFTLAPTQSDFGISRDQETDQDIPITALAICRYAEEPKQFYLFACDVNWIVRGDLLYNSIEEAKSDAERYYETEPLTWKNEKPTSA